MAIVIGVILAIIFMYFLIIYNVMIKRQNEVEHAKSSIDVYLTQRFDLIPNLVTCVKEYAKYEEKIFEEITELRTEYLKTKELSNGEKLEKELNDVILTVENYPELKANEQFLNLQKNLTKMENQIQAARRIYNNVINIFPNTILAKLLKFKTAEFFQKGE